MARLDIIIVHPDGSVQRGSDENLGNESISQIKKDWEDLFPDCKIEIED